VLRLPHPLSLIELSADNFAYYNDEHGREAGDALLLYLVQELSATVRRHGHDMVAHLVGTHFAVILPNTSAAGALSSSRRFRASIQASDRLHANDHLTIRVSIATLRPDRHAT
jgi:diguanylate cyclase (GGDEF)-like protein